MKNICLLATIVSGFIFVACQKTNTNIVHEVPTIRLWAGTDSTISLSSLQVDGSVFTITSDNKDIAGVAINNHNLIIESYKAGIVNIVLTNEQNKVFHIKVQPVDMRAYDIGYWMSFHNEKYTSFVTVKATDTKFADSLYNALQSEIADPDYDGYYRYFFDTDKFSLLKNHSIIKEGAYVYNKLTLTLSYNNKTEVYKIIPVGSVSPIMLERNLTDEIQRQFPDKGVTEVSTHQYFYYYKLPG